MDLRDQVVAGAVVLRPGGRIDHRSASGFAAALQPYLDQCRDGAGSVVLDLSETEYMSSVGLRVLMLAARQVNGQSGRIVLCGLQPVMREIIEISRFHLVLEVFGSPEEALAAVGS